MPLFWVAVVMLVLGCAAIAAGVALAVVPSRRMFTRTSRRSIQPVIDSVKEPLFVLDGKGRVFAVNASAAKLFPELAPLLGNRQTHMPLPYLLDSVVKEPESFEGDKTRYVYVNWKAFRPAVTPLVRGKNTLGATLRLHDMTDYHSSYLRLSASNLRLMQNVQDTRSKIDSIRSRAVAGAIQFLHDKDETSGDHMRRSSNYTHILARAMQQDGLYPDVLTDRYVEVLSQVAPLHDVGKFFMAEEILKKPDELTPQEFEAVKSHVSLGAQMIDRMLADTGDDQYTRVAKEVALYHHERWDGTGYLSGLKGAAIPLAARIVAVATVFDLVSTDRPYKEAQSFDEAFDTVARASGTQFDPDIIKSFVGAKEAFRAAYNQMIRPVRKRQFQNRLP